MNRIRRAMANGVRQPDAPEDPAKHRASRAIATAAALVNRALSGIAPGRAIVIVSAV
jgi:hypothetical protein